MINDFEVENEECTCDDQVQDNILDGQSSSSEEEEELYCYIVPLIKEDEMKNLINSIPNPLNGLKPMVHLFDERMSEKIIQYLNPNTFFVDESQSKIPFFISLPNSYLPLLKKSPESKDPICAPSYMSEAALIEFHKVQEINENTMYPSQAGLSLKYDIDKRLDLISTFVYFQRDFYEKMLKERLINKTNKKINEHDYNFPLTLYEPNTFIKRFCDVFCYLSACFEIIYEKPNEEEYIVKKLNLGLISGFQKVMSSQGIPLPPHIGETYEVRSENGELHLFAECKNDSPIKLVYNIRWRGRLIIVDGYADIKFMFNEDEDAMIMKISGLNKLKMYKKKEEKLYQEEENKKKKKQEPIDEYRTIYFTLPLKISFKGVVEAINYRNERISTVDTLMYVKSEIVSSITAFNWYGNENLFNSFYGLISKKIINFDTVQTGHNFIGIIFHNSGFSFEGFNEAKPLMDFFVRKKEDPNSTTMRSVSPNDKSFFIEQNDKKNQTMKNFSHVIGDVSKVNNMSPMKHANKSSIDVVPKNKAEQSEMINQNEESQSNQMISLNGNVPESSKDLLLANKKMMRKRINRNPNVSYYKLFIKVVNYLQKLSSAGSFITCFSLNFIYKVIIGSWCNLNFYEISYTTNELAPIYLKFDINYIQPMPVSKLNLKAGLKLVYENFHFFNNMKEVYGENLWQHVRMPLPMDTRYREDLLWLRNFHKLHEEDEDNSQKRQEELEKLKMEAFVNATKWKELIEGYSFHNISSKLNNIEQA
jgi:hypothetical protein